MALEVLPRGLGWRRPPRARLSDLRGASWPCLCLSCEGAQSEEFLWEAHVDLGRLLRLVTDSATGPCWGFPFDWPTNQGLVPADVPASTQTAYGFDLVDALWGASEDPGLLRHIGVSLTAMDLEYRDLPRPIGIASTYHGRGYGDVVLNAVTYRIHIAARAAVLLDDCRRLREGQSLTDYVLSQAESGWELVLRGVAEKPASSTTSILRSCSRTSRGRTERCRRSDVEEAIRRGIAFYWSHLFDGSGLPRPFAKSVRLIRCDTRATTSPNVSAFRSLRA